MFAISCFASFSFIFIYLISYANSLWKPDDNLFIIFCGFYINHYILHVTNFFIKNLGLTTLIMNNEAQKRDRILNNNNIKPGSICFLGDSEFTTWYFLENDLSCLNYKSFNSGFGGARTIDIINNIDSLCINWLPKIVFIHIGGNDYDFNTTLSTESLILYILNNINIIHSRLYSYNIKCIFIFTPPRPVYSIDKIRFFKKLYLKIQQLYFIIDLRHISHPPSHFRTDNLHLNHIGHKYKSKYIINQIKTSTNLKMPGVLHL